MFDWVKLRMIALVVIVATAILMFDLSLPLGVAGGVPYEALVLLGIWLPKPRHIILLAIIGTILTLVGYVMSAAGGVEWMVLTNRGLALFVIWVTAILLVYLKRGQARLHQAKEELQQYLDIVDQNVITSTTDRYGKIISASDAFCRISGYSREELIGKAHNIVRHPDMPKSLYRDLWGTILKGDDWDGEIKNRRKDGSYYWVAVHITPLVGADGTITGFTAIRQDITDRKHVEELSITDRLTQLFNRLKLDEEIHKEIARAERYGHPLSIVLLDVDYFKDVNDTYGHQVGDQVLARIADLVRSNVREIDIAGRWGGEEFLIICPETSEAKAAAVAEKLRGVFSSHEFPMVGSKTASFGVAEYIPGEKEAAMVGRADAALYRAKELGRNRVELASG